MRFQEVFLAEFFWQGCSGGGGSWLRLRCLLHFALLDYQNPGPCATRNGCFTLDGARYYLFCVNQEALRHLLWTQGWVDLLPLEGFVSQDPQGMWRRTSLSGSRWPGFLLSWARFGKRIGS